MTEVTKETHGRMEVVSPLSSCTAFICGRPSSLEMNNENFSDENMLTEQRCVICPKDLKSKDQILQLIKTFFLDFTPERLQWSSCVTLPT